MFSKINTIPSRFSATNWLLSATYYMSADIVSGVGSTLGGTKSQFLVSRKLSWFFAIHRGRHAGVL